MCLGVADYQDAAFLLPQTSHGPLHCTSPADVYLLLKSSDFITHGTDPSTAYEGVEDDESRTPSEASVSSRGMKIELVLKEYIQVNPAREARCFVRNNMLLGESWSHRTPCRVVLPHFR